LLALDWSKEIKGLSHDVVILWKTHRYSTLSSVLNLALAPSWMSMRHFKLKCAHSPLNLHILSSISECPIYTHDVASAKFSTNSHETDYSEVNAGVDKIKYNAFPSFYYNYLQLPKIFSITLVRGAEAAILSMKTPTESCDTENTFRKPPMLCTFGLILPASNDRSTLNKIEQ